MAAIEFLQQELEEMKKREEAQVPEVHSAASTPEAKFFDSKDQRGISPLCSPTAPCPLPTVTNECYHGRHLSSTALSKQPPFLSSTISGQEIVFSVVDGPVVQRRKRKKMTATEKIAYKQMRRVGACDSCKRQKAKVDSPGMLDNKVPVRKADLDTVYPH